MDTASRFAGRSLCIATMHGKEAAIAPVLQQRLGVRCVLPPDGFDSDRFGTFSGEVPREGSPLEVARRKAQAAMKLAGVDLAVASEGSFGSHPDAFLLPIGTELLLLVDRRDDLEIPAEHVTRETNFGKRTEPSPDDLGRFCKRTAFPSHALVVTVDDPPQQVWRGIASEAELIDTVAEASAAAGRLGTDWHVSADMRADRNPTRMRAIAQAAEELATRALTRCPGCSQPGFGRVDVVRGLPCGSCGEPTRWVRAVVHGCAHCDTRAEVARDDHRVDVDPMHCPICNP